MRNLSSNVTVVGEVATLQDGTVGIVTPGIGSNHITMGIMIHFGMVEDLTMVASYHLTHITDFMIDLIMVITIIIDTTEIVKAIRIRMFEPGVLTTVIIDQEMSVEAQQVRLIRIA